jgi:hypothetical protein
MGDWTVIVLRAFAFASTFVGRILAQVSAAIELRTGREAGLIGGDEQRQPRDLVRLGHARNRQQ